MSNNNFNFGFICDLGVDVDSSLKYDGHINRIVAKAYSRIGILFRGFFNRNIIWFFYAKHKLECVFHCLLLLFLTLVLNFI